MYKRIVLETTNILELPETPIFIGSGKHGVVFDIGNGLVLKHTTNNIETTLAQVIKKDRPVFTWGIESVTLISTGSVIIGEKLVETRKSCLLKNAVNISTMLQGGEVSENNTVVLEDRYTKETIDLGVEHYEAVVGAKKLFKIKRFLDSHYKNCMFDVTGRLKLIDVYGV